MSVYQYFYKNLLKCHNMLVFFFLSIKKMDFLLGKKRCNKTEYDAEGNATIIKRNVSWICIIFAILSCISAFFLTQMALIGSHHRRQDRWDVIIFIILHCAGSIIFLSHCTRCDSWPGFWKSVIAGFIANVIGIYIPTAFRGIQDNLPSSDLLEESPEERPENPPTNSHRNSPRRPPTNPPRRPPINLPFNSPENPPTNSSGRPPTRS